MSRMNVGVSVPTRTLTPSTRQRVTHRSPVDPLRDAGTDQHMKVNPTNEPH